MRMRRRYKSKTVKGSGRFPSKSNQILNLIFFIFLIIALRLWHLCVFQHEEKIQEVLKPQQKVFVQNANRGGIYDRFGIPLAVNKIQYRVGIFYSPIRQIPSIAFKKIKRAKSGRFTLGVNTLRSSLRSFQVFYI